MSYHYKPVVLAILDGWGVAPKLDSNAIAAAKLPNYQKYLANYPAMILHASGAEVGLAFGQMGNSEVGHLNIGCGRIYYQSGPRINTQISSGNFFANTAFLNAIEHAKKNRSALHLIGLLGNGQVHASGEHLVALLQLCAQQKFKNVFIHLILDGRDTRFDSGKDFLVDLVAKLKELKVGKIASICGRYYAMDRDNRWDRLAQAYQAIASGKSKKQHHDPLAALKESYDQKIYDEEFAPTVILDKEGLPIGKINNGDSAIFFNYRPDRARQLTKAFVLPGFNKFDRRYIRDLFFVTMTEYEKDLPVEVAFKPMIMRNCLAEAVSKSGGKQLHVAETEKYAHITFFLNGMTEDPFPGEERVLVPSPRVANYCETPEMSAKNVARETIKGVESGKYDLIAVNFANADMVGHSGDFKATSLGCEAIDKYLGEIVERALAVGGAVVVTADHGNAEELLNLQTGGLDKEHSTNPVPLLVIAKEFMGQAGATGDPLDSDLSLLPCAGVLADVAPTVLKLMGLDKPDEMTGKPLI